MDGPASLVGSTTPPVVPILSAETVGDVTDASKVQPASKNGKRAESGSGGSSFFSWFIVLALLGVWTSVAVVYFDLVDYQGVLGKLVAYDTDGDGDFDIEDAKVLLDEKPGEPPCSGAHKEPPSPKDVGFRLREALKQQLAIIHERVEAKRLAKLALAEVRQLLLKEEELKELELERRKEIPADGKKRVAARLKEEEERIEKEEMEKLNEGKTQQHDGSQEEERKVDEEDRKWKKPGGKEGKNDGRGTQNQSKSQGGESGKKRKAEDSKRRRDMKA